MPLFGEEKKEYQRKWMADRRKKLIDILGGACYECLSINNLEFHHKFPKEKEKTVNQILSYKWERVIEEIKKCDLLCEECHKKKSYNKDVVHGTYDGYQHHGCRCEMCKSAKRLSR